VTAKKVITLQTAMTKKGRQFFPPKIGVTPSVAAQGDTNPSDTIDHQVYLIKQIGARNNVYSVER